jgi:RNA polymerase subunit RPABC4/transcription elongation factor Spt4
MLPNKKRILWKMTLIGLAVFVISAAGLFGTDYIRRRNELRNENAWRQYREDQVRKFRSHLQETAKQVTKLPVDPNIVGQVQARYFEEYPRARLYLWAMDGSGQFQFGIPREAFARLNRAYDTYQKVIEQEGRFTDRQDFIRRLVQNHRNLTFDYYEKRLAGDAAATARSEYEEIRGYDQEGLVFSTPFQNERGELLGNMFLKVTNLEHDRPYSYFNYQSPRELSLILLVSSLIFLWFLLPTWVYLDAKGRGMDSPVRWSILTLVSLFVGLAVYLIVRPEEGIKGICQNCGRSLGAERFCPFCGSPATHEFCARCGYPVRTEWTYCPNCQAATQRAQEGTPAGSQGPPAGQESGA